MNGTTGPFPDLGQLLHEFFLERLARHRRVSPCTLVAYRDAWKLLLAFAAARLHRPPARLTLRVLAVPRMGCERGPVDHLSRPEIHALLEAAVPSSWSGHRDRVFLEVLYNTGNASPRTRSPSRTRLDKSVSG
jgi:site-specific recombinase XerD